MMKVYEDKNFEEPLLIADYTSFKKKINPHSTTLVLICAIKIFD